MARLLLRELTPGTAYKVQIRAVDGDSHSEWSRLFPLTTTNDSAAPDVPTWAASPWVVNGDAFVATWNDLNHSLEQNLDFSHFEIELSDTVTTKVIQTTNTTYTLTFENNRIFFGSPKATVLVRVRSVDETGNASAWSTQQSATNPAPDPVGSITVTAILNGVKVEWPASTAIDFKEYELEVSTTSSSAGFSNVYTGLNNNFTYVTATTIPHWFRVRVKDKFNSGSTYVTSGSVTPTSPFTPDTTPPPLPAFDTPNCTITNNANGVGARASLTWTMSSTPSDLAGYYIRWRRSGDTVWTTQTFSKDVLTGQIELQQAFVNHQFQIKSFDWMNNESAWSATLTVTSPANSAPAQVTGLVSTAGRDSIVYKWNAVADTDIKDYEVTFSTSATFASGNITYFTGTATTLTVGGLLPNTTYYARVRAVDTAGNTSASWSSTDTDTTGQIVPTDGYPPASSPTPNVMSGLSNLYLTWAAVTTNSNGGTQLDPVTYEVHLSTSSGFTPSAGTKVTEVDGLSAIIDVLPGTTTPLSYGTTYYIKIIARDRDGSAAASAQGSGSTSKVASGDVVSINADLIVNGTGFANALVIATGGSLSSANYVANTSGYRLSTSGLEINNGSVKASLLIGDTLTSSTGVIQIGSGASIVMNGGYLKSNTYTGTSEASNPSGAGFYLGNDGLRVDSGKISASTLNIGGTITSGNIILGGSGTAGTIQTSGYNGTSGFRLSANGLEIPDGTLTAKKVVLKNGVNLLRPEYADFESLPAWYDSNLTPANSTIQIRTDTPYNNKQYIRHTRVGTLTSNLYMGINASDYNTPIQGGEDYVYSVYMRGHPTIAALVTIGVRWSDSTFGTTQVSVPAGSPWTRYSTTVKTAPAAATEFVGFHRIDTATDALYVDYDAAQMEVATGGSPAVWSAPGSTSLDGNMIRTGSIISNTYAVVWNDTTQTWDTDTSQPAWYIDMEGDASFGNARVRGTLVIGEIDGSGNVIGLESVVQSANYVPASADAEGTGWIIRSNGFAEFWQVVANSFDGKAIKTDSLDVSSLTSSALDKKITLASGSSLAAEGSLGEEVSLGAYGFRVFGPDQVAITNKALNSNFASLTTDVPHGFTAGNTVIVEGVGSPFDGTYTINGTPTSTTFTYARTNANIASTAATGIAKSKDSTNQNTGPKFIEFPTDGTQPNIISGTLTADTLIVNDGMAMYGVNNLQNGATLTIASAVLAPKSAPTVTVGYNDKPLSGTVYTPRGAVVGHDGHYYVMSDGGANKYAITRHSSTSGSKLSTPVDYNVTSTVYTYSYGIFYSSNFSKYYRLQYTQNRSLSTHTVIVYDTSFAQVGSFNVDSSTYEWGGGTNACLGYDYVNNRLLLAFKDDATGSLKIRAYNMNASGVPTGTNSTLTVPSSTGVSKPQFIAFGAFDFGENVYVYKDRTYSTSTIRANFYVMDSSGNAKSSLHWPGAYSTDVYGGWWNATDSKFYDLGSTKAVRQYNAGDSTTGKTNNVTNKALTSNVATLTTSAAHDLRIGDNVTVAGVDATFNGTYAVTGTPTTTTFTYAKTAANVASQAATGTAVGATFNRYIAYTWYDGNATGTTHETNLSPVKTITDWPKRASMNVTISQIPGLGSTGQDSPNQARVYVAHDNTTPATTTYRLSNTLTYPSTTAYIDPYRSATTTTTPPTTNGFGTDSSTVGVIQSTTGNSFWKGDDTAAFYKMILTSDSNATVNAGNRPALRIGAINLSTGEATGVHLRVGDNGIFAMQDDDTVGDAFTLRAWQINMNAENGYGIFTGGSNINFKMRTLSDTGTSVVLNANNVTFGIATYNAASPNDTNTAGINAAGIHSWTGGIFMEDLAGGGSTTATINNSGRLVRTSTLTMKEAVQDMTKDEAYSVLGLKSYTFEYKKGEDACKDPRRYPGFIAEQGAEAGAELWVGRQHKVVRDEEGNIIGYERDVNGTITSFRTSDVTVAHNYIIKDHESKIAALEARVAELESALAG